MGTKLVHDFSQKLHLKDVSAISKAEELHQLLDVRVGSTSLSSLGLTGHCPVVMCLDLAAAHCGCPLNKTDAIRLSGVNKKIYTNGIKALESMLGLQSQVSIRDLTVQFGCTGAVNLAVRTMKSYGESCADLDTSNSLFQVASVCAACRALKLKVDWTKLREVCSVKKTTYDKLVSEMEKIAVKFIDDKKVVHGKKSSSLMDSIEQQMNEQSTDTKQLKLEESLSDRTEDDDDYEEWKARILASARVKLAGKESSNSLFDGP